MPKTRELTLQERSELICALAVARSNHFRKASSLHAEACAMEDEGKNGYLAKDNEGEQREIAADVCDILLDFAAEDRLLIVEREDAE